jgi:hypothetical protein
MRSAAVFAATGVLAGFELTAVAAAAAASLLVSEACMSRSLTS